MGMSEQEELWVKSIYGAKARQPFVELHYQDTVLQLEPEKAREVARMLQESAEASEQDAFLFEWAVKDAEVSEEGAASLLHQFRKWREERNEKGNHRNDQAGDL